MDKIFRVLGGRKFLLTVSSMAAAIAIDLLTAAGLSVALAGFLGAALSAFCASNWLNSKEFHKADAAKRKGGNQELSRIESKLTKLLNIVDNPENIEYYESSLTQINQALGEVITAQANILQTTQSTNTTINAVIKAGQ